MKKASSLLLSAVAILLILYLIICLLLYSMQERIIFLPTKLTIDHVFRFRGSFEERYLKATDGTQLHGVLFHSDSLAASGSRSSQGLIFFLHGNAGALDGWGDLASFYTRYGYDVFMLDYRGYGKSMGKIENEQQFLGDVQAAYEQLSQEYNEQDIIVVGFSIGSGPASMLAGKNSPAMLILLAPYYSLTDIMRRSFPFAPPVLLKYRFKTHLFLDQTKAPVYIFHGTEDTVIPLASSLKLRDHLKAGDQHIILEGVGHNEIHDTREYITYLSRLLETAPEK